MLNYLTSFTPPISQKKNSIITITVAGGLFSHSVNPHTPPHLSERVFGGHVIFFAV